MPIIYKIWNSLNISGHQWNGNQILNVISFYSITYSKKGVYRVHTFAHTNSLQLQTKKWLKISKHKVSGKYINAYHTQNINYSQCLWPLIKWKSSPQWNTILYLTPVAIVTTTGKDTAIVLPNWNSQFRLVGMLKLWKWSEAS